jgi:hypothetical protein
MCILVSFAKQRLGENETAKTNTYATTEELSEGSFCMRSVSYQKVYAISSSQTYLLVLILFICAVFLSFAIKVHTLPYASSRLSYGVTFYCTYQPFPQLLTSSCYFRFAIFLQLSWFFPTSHVVFENNLGKLGFSFWPASVLCSVLLMPFPFTYFLFAQRSIWSFVCYICSFFVKPLHYVQESV